MKTTMTPGPDEPQDEQRPKLLSDEAICDWINGQMEPGYKLETDYAAGGVWVGYANHNERVCIEHIADTYQEAMSSLIVEVRDQQRAQKGQQSQ